MDKDGTTPIRFSSQSHAGSVCYETREPNVFVYFDKVEGVNVIIEEIEPSGQAFKWVLYNKNILGYYFKHHGRITIKQIDHRPCFDAYYFINRFNYCSELYLNNLPKQEYQLGLTVPFQNSSNSNVCLFTSMDQTTSINGEIRGDLVLFSVFKPPIKLIKSITVDNAPVSLVRASWMSASKYFSITAERNTQPKTVTYSGYIGYGQVPPKPSKTPLHSPAAEDFIKPLPPRHKNPRKDTQNLLLLALASVCFCIAAIVWSIIMIRNDNRRRQQEMTADLMF